MDYLEDLCNACIKGDEIRVKYWIDKKVDLNVPFPDADYKGAMRTPLSFAVEYGHINIVHLLLQNGVDINKGRIDNDSTPLIAAV